MSLDAVSQKSQIPIWLQKLPNRLTYLRILCIPLVVFFMSYGQLANQSWKFWELKPIHTGITDIVAACIFCIAAVTDFFDGWLARKYHIETMLGKLLDPLADKLLVVSAMIILVENHRMEGWIAVVIIVRDLGINAIRLAAMDEGILIASNWIGKTKTVFQDIGIVGLTIYSTVLGLPCHVVGYFFIILAMCVSVVSAVQYLFDYGKQLNQRKL